MTFEQRPWRRKLPIIRSHRGRIENRIPESMAKWAESIVDENGFSVSDRRDACELLEDCFKFRLTDAIAAFSEDENSHDRLKLEFSLSLKHAVETGGFTIKCPYDYEIDKYINKDFVDSEFARVKATVTSARMSPERAVYLTLLEYFRSAVTCIEVETSGCFPLDKIEEDFDSFVWDDVYEQILRLDEAGHLVTTFHSQYGECWWANCADFNVDGAWF